MSEFDF